MTVFPAANEGTALKGNSMSAFWMGRMLFVALASASAALPARTHAADSYPNRPIRLIVPFAPGGSNDILARTLAQRLTSRFGQTVVVDNRAGAGGIIGVETTARSAPDGYTLVMGHIGTHAVNPALYKSLPYDAARDFTPVAPVASSPNILLVHPSVAASSVKVLVVLARSKPAQLNYASGGIGGSTHLSAELFKMMTGTDFVHVPYKGGGPALTAIIAGDVAMLFNNIVSAMPYVKSGKVRALGITSRQRSTAMTEVPTLAEAGVPGYEVVSWYGVLGPAGMPSAVVLRLNIAITAVMTSEEMRTRLAAEGVDIMKASPGEFAEYVKNEIAKWGKVIRQAGIRAD
jgi:tripartite-type tricarboxylate transporter receptor subunit TctC